MGNTHQAERIEAYRRCFSPLIGREIVGISYDTIHGQFHSAVYLKIRGSTPITVTCRDAPGFDRDRFSVVLDVTGSSPVAGGAFSHAERPCSFVISKIAIVDFDEWYDPYPERPLLPDGAEEWYFAGPLGSAPAGSLFVRQCMGVAFFDDSRGAMLYYEQGSYWCSVAEITDRHVFASAKRECTVSLIEGDANVRGASPREC